MLLGPPRFPNAPYEQCVPASATSTAYNCIAFCMGDANRWWWPDAAGMYYWPAILDRIVSVPAFAEMFAHHAYTPCTSSDIEDGFEKIALYVSRGVPTHASKQLVGGSWSSKLGSSIDIEHSLRALEGPYYGQVEALFKRSL